MRASEDPSIATARGHRRTPALLALPLCLAFVIVPMLLASELLTPLGLLDSRGDPIGSHGLIAFLLVPFTLIAALVLLWARVAERRSPSSIGLGGAHPLAVFMRGYGIGAGMIAAVVATVWAAGGYVVRDWTPALSAPAVLPVVLAMALAFAVQASTEELLFRGWLLSTLAARGRVVLAVALGSGLFGLLHWSPDQHWLFTVNIVLFGVFTSAWTLKAGSVWGVMGWHSGWNWLLATGFELPVTGLDAGVPALLVALEPAGPQWLTGGAAGSEGSVICTIAFLAGIAWLGRRWRSLPRSTGSQSQAEPGEGLPMAERRAR